MMHAVRLRNIPFLFVLCLITFITVAPFYIMIVMATHATNDLFGGLRIIPGDNLLRNIKTVFTVNYVRYFANSIFVAVTRTVLMLVSSAMCGYGLAKYQFPLKKFLFSLVLASLMIPGSLGLVAFVWIMKQIHWMNTYLPLIVPGIANAFGVFWMRQYILEAVPGEIIESARIDGSGEIKTFFRIVFPLLKPGLATLGFLSFIMSWNEYIMARIIISNVKLYTIPLGIANLGSMYQSDVAARILGLVIGIFPVLFVFIIGSKRIIHGLTAGSLKG